MSAKETPLSIVGEDDPAVAQIRRDLHARRVLRLVLNTMHAELLTVDDLQDALDVLKRMEGA
ncbi:MAG TPA: hypothetical protein PKY87_14630 [Terricaulis sp.]|nr:hypothetical protein [Terricaulis sp.]